MCVRFDQESGEILRSARGESAPFDELPRESRSIFNQQGEDVRYCVVMAAHADESLSGHAQRCNQHGTRASFSVELPPQQHIAAYRCERASTQPTALGVVELPSPGRRPSRHRSRLPTT